jgi:hypothetical protein
MQTIIEWAIAIPALIAAVLIFIVGAIFIFVMLIFYYILIACRFCYDRPYQFIFRKRIEKEKILKILSKTYNGNMN